MKKVVLLAGALAAGMAVAPVTANAAAPKGPEVNLAPDEAPYQDYEHYYNVLAARHTDLELMKQDVQDAIADPTTAKDDYKGMSAKSLALILADIQDQINELDKLQTDVKTLYDAMSTTDKNNPNYTNTAWDTAVQNAIDYITTKVTADQFDKLLETYKAFDAQHRIWEEYDKWYNGTTAGEQNDGTDTGFIDNLATYKETDNYKEVDETDDVVTKVGDIDTKKTTFEGILVEPKLDGDNHTIVYGINDTLAGELATAKSGLLADFNEDTAAPGALNALVDLYHTDQTALSTGTDEVVDGDKTVHSLKAIVDGYGTGDSAVEGYDNTIDPTADADFINKDGNWSTYYATEIQNAQADLDAKIDAAKDFIETFDAADAAAWRDNTDLNYQKGEGTTFTDEAGYKTQAVALLDEIQTLVNDYNELVQAAKDNVEAYNDLVDAEVVSQGKMDDAFLDDTKTTKTDGTTPVSYWNRNDEVRNLGASPALESTVVDGTGYVYRQFIEKLQKELNDVNSDYSLAGTSTDDIHDQIISHFDAPVVVDGVLEDASVYKTQKTDSENVIFGEFNAKVATLEGQIEDNETANGDLHDMEDALEQHVQDMYDTCVGYDDVDAADFAAGGDFWSSGDCEDGRHYNGYIRVRRDDVGGFKLAEVNAYNSFDPEDATKGAKAFLESTEDTGAPAMKWAADKSIELLWNHVATVQCQAHLDDITTKMETEYGNAKDLDKVCIDNATVWDWKDDATRTCVCEENDTKENPCGWCEPTTKGLLADIVKTFNETEADLATKHAISDTAAKTEYVDADTLYPEVGTAKSLVADFKAYEEAAAGVDGTIDEWYASFEAADAAHDQKLQDLKDEADQYVHEYIHEIVGDMSLALNNYEEGDLAAANLWAQNLENRTFPVYSTMGGEPTNEGLDLDLDGATDSYVGFEAYVDAVRAAEGIYTAKIKELYDLHKWTELRKIADRAKDVHPATDYQKAVDTNRTATIALYDKLATAQATLDAARDAVDQLKVYSPLTNMGGEVNDFAALTSTANATDPLAIAQKALDDEKAAIEAANKDGKAGSYTEGGATKPGYEFQKATVDAAIDAYVAAVHAAEFKYQANHEAYQALEAALTEFEAVAALGLEAVTKAAAEGAIYSIPVAGENNDALDIAAKVALLGIGTDGKVATEHTHYVEEFKAATLAANSETEKGHLAALAVKVKDVEDALIAAAAFKAKEEKAAAAFNEQVNDLEVLQQSLDTTWAVYDDIDNDKDAAALNAAYKAVTEAIAAERKAIADDLKAGNVQAHAEDYVEGGETVKGHNTVIGDINSAIKDIQDNVREYEKFYADEHALADKYNDELNNLETLRDALGTVWDAYETLDDSDQTLTALHNDWQAITEALAAERAAVEADLEAGNVQAHATTDYTVEEGGVTVEKKAHETAIGDIADAIKTLQDKVRGIEEFKATNDKNYAALVEATKDILASLDDVKYVSDDVYELLPATEAAADLDQESIEAAREAAKTLANTELTALETALAAGHLYTDAEVAAQQAKIDEVTDALEALKEQVKAAEDFRRANAEANDKLEEKVQALVTIINTAKANSVCDLCNAEDTADLEAELDAVYEILGNVAESFAVGHLAMPMVTDNYAKYMQDLGAVEADVQTTLDEIAEHKVRQINDQNAYNVLQKALTDVDLWLANVQLEEGWENFAVRTDHCSNKTEGLKYLNELTDDVNDLKALIETQHSHAGGHVCEENKIDDMKAMKVLIEDAKTLIAAIQANEAAKVILDAQFEEVAGLVNDALEFWEDNYMDKTLVQLEDIIAYWTGTPVEKGQLQKMYDLIQDKYQHGAAAYDWTVDAKGEEFKQDVIDDVEKQKQDIEMHRNTAANYEAINHMDEVEAAMDALVAEVKADVTEGDMVDPFVKELYADFLELVGEYAVDNEGLYGVLAQIDATRNENYLAGTLEDAINIDERSKIKGIHQMLDELKANAETLVATYNDLFEHAHHLTNGKTLYSDMQYVTIGFFRHANEGLGEQATEMFKVVEPHFDAVAGNIGIYDTNWLNVLDWEDVNDTPDNWFDDVPAAYERDFAGHLVHQDGLGEIPAKVGVLGHGDKKNELTFTLNDEQDYENAEIRTLAAGAADITFKPGSLTVDGWNTKHNVYIEVNVETPTEETVDAPVTTGSNKLIVRLDNPIDLTYTINSLVARTNDGTEFSYADRVINYAANTLEFNLPEGTTSVELPEGFFTFRTGENTIARSAAMVVTVGGTTTIEGLIAMGEKAQIFDLQGRRVKAEALISGNTYVVNGEKVMVK